VIDYVKPFVDNGEQCIEIKSSITGTDDFWIFKLSKDNFWCVKEAYEHAGNFWHKSHCVYDGFHEKIPLLKNYRVDYGRYDLDIEKTEQLTSQVQYEVTQIIPGPVDLSEFEVAQFLPPETRIGEVTTTQFSWFRSICILLGILLFIVGGWLKMRKV
jgi:hypothetical protein